MFPKHRPLPNSDDVSPEDNQRDSQFRYSTATPPSLIGYATVSPESETCTRKNIPPQQPGNRETKQTQPFTTLVSNQNTVRPQLEPDPVTQPDHLKGLLHKNDIRE